MDLYIELRNNPPLIKVKDGARELRIKLISVMCDNAYTLSLKKKPDGDFKLNGLGYSLSNYQFTHEPWEIEWAADNQEWDQVRKMLDSGTAVVENIMSR